MGASRRTQREPKILGAAVAEPAAASDSIPINRDLSVPFTRRPGTPKDEEVRKRIVNAVWNTPLGQTLMAFLYDHIDPVELPSRARQFNRLIFADGAQISTRLAAMQLLSEDLYVHERLDHDVLTRLMLLQTNLAQEAINGQNKTKNAVVQLCMLFFILSLPFGSPVVRDETMKMWSRPAKFFKRILRLVKEDQKLKGIELHRLFQRDVFKGYEISAAVNIFFASFGPISMLFFLYKEWSDGLTGQLVHDKIMLLGLDTLLHATEF
jgi:hypothetical protein